MRVRHRSRTRRGNVKQRRKPIIAAFACAIAIAATAAMTVSMRANAASVSSPGSLAVGQGNINYVETGDTSSHGYGMPRYRANNANALCVDRSVHSPHAVARIDNINGHYGGRGNRIAFNSNTVTDLAIAQKYFCDKYGGYDNMHAYCGFQLFIWQYCGDNTNSYNGGDTPAWLFAKEFPGDSFQNVYNYINANKSKYEGHGLYLVAKNNLQPMAVFWLTEAQYRLGVSTTASPSIANPRHDTIKDGHIYEIRLGVNHGKSVNIHGNLSTEAAPATLYDADGTDAEKFIAHIEHDGSVTFQHYGTDKHLAGGLLAKHQDVGQYARAYQWSVETYPSNSAYVRIRSLYTRLCINDANLKTANNSKLQMYPDNGHDTANQWYLNDLGEAPAPTVDATYSSGNASHDGIVDGHTYEIESAAQSGHVINFYGDTGTSGNVVKLLRNDHTPACWVVAHVQSDGSVLWQHSGTNQYINVGSSSGSALSTHSHTATAWQVKSNSDGSVSMIAVSNGLRIALPSATATDGNLISSSTDDSASRWKLTDLGPVTENDASITDTMYGGIYNRSVRDQIAFTISSGKGYFAQVAHETIIVNLTLHYDGNSSVAAKSYTKSAWCKLDNWYDGIDNAVNNEFFPDEFGWDAWPSGTYWFSLNVPKQGHMSAAVAETAKSSAESFNVVEPNQPVLSTTAVASQNITEGIDTTSEVNDSILLMPTTGTPVLNLSVTTTLHMTPEGSTEEKTTSQTWTATSGTTCTSPGFAPSSLGLTEWAQGHYWFTTTIAATKYTNEIMAESNPNDEQFDIKKTYGKIKLRKSSTLPDYTNAHPTVFSLANAVYGIYMDEACITAAQDLNGNEATITTDSTGNGTSGNLLAGTYYLKEKTNPQGYALSATVTQATVTAAGTTNVAVTDKPITVIRDALMKKLDGSYVTTAGKFSFTNSIYHEKDGTVSLVRTDTATNDDQGKITFPDYDVTETGEYLLLSSETTGNDPNMQYDKHCSALEYTIEQDNNALVITGTQRYIIDSVPDMSSVTSIDTILANAKADNSGNGCTFSNDTLGEIILQKVVDGNANDSTPFTYDVTLKNASDAPVTSVMIDGKSESSPTGVYKVKVSATKQATITKLPIGTTYSVSEESTQGYSQVSSSGANGEITTSANVVTVSFTNAQTERRKLTLKKIVSGGDDADVSAKYAFMIVLSDMGAGWKASTSNGDAIVADASGKATVSVSLKDGESFAITNLPVGTKYVVTETGGKWHPSFAVVASNGGTVVKSRGTASVGSSLATASETLSSGEDDSVTFTNVIPLPEVVLSLPLTGMGGVPLVSVIIGGVAGVVCVVVVIKRHSHGRLR